MTLDDLKAELGAILVQEERDPVDRPQVEERCLQLSLRLPESGLSDSHFPHEIYHFLADSDIRRKDELYAAEQRTELRKWLTEGIPTG